jgi:hypothetical protein
LGIGTIAVRHTLRIVGDKKVRIPTGKRLVSESLARRADPLAMPFFRGLARRIGERSENFDQYVLAAQAEGRASAVTFEAAPLNSCVKTAQPGETAAAMAPMKASVLSLSNAGSQLVSMKVRCPSTR